MEALTAWSTLAAAVIAAVGVAVAIVSVRQVGHARFDAAAAAASAVEATEAARRSATAAERSADVAEQLRAIEKRREHDELRPRITFSIDREGDRWHLAAENQGPLECAEVVVRLEPSQGDVFPLRPPCGFLAANGQALLIEDAWTIAALRPGERPTRQFTAPHADGRLIVTYRCTADGHDPWEDSYPLLVEAASSAAREPARPDRRPGWAWRRRPS